MPIDTSYVLLSLIMLIISIVVFLISFRIYYKTKGASVAYKMWAIGTALITLTLSLYIINGVVFESTKTSSDNEHEITLIVANSIGVCGYFYIPVGIMYLEKDMDMGRVDEKLIKKSQFIFYSIIILIFGIFMTLVPFFELRKSSGVIFNLLYSLVWIFTAYYYYPLYKNLKSINLCWSFFYLAILASFGNNTFSMLSVIFSDSFFIIILTFELMMAIGFIGGFLMLAKMVEAV